MTLFRATADSEVAADERDVAETVPSPAPTMYLGLDGTGVPVRPAEVEGRRGKQPDGSAKTREVKLATMWTAEGRDKAGRPVRDRGSVSYNNAAVESAASRDTDPLPSAFAQRAYREAQRRGFDTAARRVVIGDGVREAPGSGSWPPSSFPAPSKSSTSTTPSSICATWPRPSTAPERTWPTSGPGTGVPSWTPAGSAPSSRRYASMSRPRPRREGAFTMCSGTDTACAIRSSAPRACALRRTASSGVVEAGCKQIGARLKRAGMRWTVAGANAIIALRCCLLSGRFEDFWERRAANAA